MLQKNQIGWLGEQIAKKHLQSKGYLIIASNYHVQAGEIDLIAKLGRKLVFVEVKTRTSSVFGFGEESFNWQKRQRLHRSILTYLKQHPVKFGWQVDLMVVELGKFNQARIRHFKAVGL